MKKELKSLKRQPCVNPADPTEMLLYKKSLEAGKLKYHRPGSLRSLLEAARASLARWSLAARIRLHGLAARISIRSSRASTAKTVHGERRGPIPPDKTPALACPPDRAAARDAKPLRRV